MPSEAFDQIAELRKPVGITDRIPTTQVPTDEQYRLASGALAVATMFGARDLDFDATIRLREWAGRFVLRHGARVLGPDADFDDALWCGVPEAAGHIYARAIVAVCADTEDIELLRLGRDLVNQVWQPRRGPRQVAALHTGLALHRHAKLCGYLADQWPPLAELIRCGTCGSGLRLVAIHHLLRVVVNDKVSAHVAAILPDLLETT